MSILQHAVVSEEGIEPEARFRHLAPPNGASRCHEVHFLHAGEWCLHVRIDRISGLKIVASRFIGCKQSQSTIPTPTLTRCGFKILVGSVANDAANSPLLIFLKNAKHRPQEVGL